MIDWVSEDPFYPIHFGKNQKGMQSSAEPVINEDAARLDWLLALEDALLSAESLEKEGCHKQIVNAVLMPFMWMNVVFSGTDDAWANFFNLRCHEAAAPEVQKQAVLMMRAYDASEPVERTSHWPFVTEDEIGQIRNAWITSKVSAARCARTSYLTTEGKTPTVEEDLALYERLAGSNPKHANPLEHPAIARLGDSTPPGNFVGWHQFRHQIDGESATRKTFDIKARLALYEGRDYLLPALESQR